MPQEKPKTTADSRDKSSMNSPRTYNSTRPLISNRQRKNLLYYLSLTAWVALCFFASQLVISFLMRLILGRETLAQPFWLFVFYLLNYTVMLTLVIFGYGWHRTPKANPRTTAVTEPTAATSPKTTSPTNSTAAAKIASPASPTVMTGIATNTTITELGVAALPTFVDIGLAPLAYILYLLCAGILLRIMQIFPWFDADQNQNVGFTGYLAGYDRFFAMLAIVFIAPIAEELLMRGWLYGKLRQKLPGRRGIIIAITITSLLFAILHGQLNVAVVTFMLSVILCLLRELTGTIWSGILLHIIVNGVAFYVRYIAIGG